MSDTTMLIETVLAGHSLSQPGGGTAAGSRCDCSCGARVDTTWGDRGYAARLGREHVADAVLAVLDLDKIRAEAWEEGLESGRDRWADSREFGDPPVNPYQKEKSNE